MVALLLAALLAAFSPLSTTGGGPLAAQPSSTTGGGPLAAPASTTGGGPL